MQCKCGSVDFCRVVKGTQVGLYCAKCNAWQKWIGQKSRGLYAKYPVKEELGVVKKGIEEVQKKSTDTSSQVVCKQCGCTEYEVRDTGMHIGIYCTRCGKWGKWIRAAEVSKYSTDGVSNIGECNDPMKVEEPIVYSHTSENIELTPTGKSAEDAYAVLDEEDILNTSEPCLLCQGQEIESEHGYNSRLMMLEGYLTVTTPTGDVLGIWKVGRCIKCGREV